MLLTLISDQQRIEDVNQAVMHRFVAGINGRLEDFYISISVFLIKQRERMKNKQMKNAGRMKHLVSSSAVRWISQTD